MNVPNINDIIAEDCIVEADIDPTHIKEIPLPFYANCTNVCNEFLWNSHYHNKLQTAVYAMEEKCYVFYSLNSFTHEKINFVCSNCFDLAKYVWFNTIPNAFSKRHHCHTEFVISCDKCTKPCKSQLQKCCTYFSFNNGIESENVSANNYVSVPFE